LSKSFCEFASVGALGVYGNGTKDVSWFTKRSTVRLSCLFLPCLCLPCFPLCLSLLSSCFRSLVWNEIPSGIDSNRYPPASVSPTVISGVTVEPGATGVSIAGLVVLNPSCL
jgi:hypothetical protein